MEVGARQDRKYQYNLFITLIINHLQGGNHSEKRKPIVQATVRTFSCRKANSNANTSWQPNNRLCVRLATKKRKKSIFTYSQNKQFPAFIRFPDFIITSDNIAESVKILFTETRPFRCNFKCDFIVPLLRYFALLINNNCSA